MSMTLEPQVKASQTSIQIDTIADCVGNIPDTTLRVAGYVTGPRQIKWDTTEWNRFKEATAKVEINQDPSSNPLTGNVLDIEGGAWSIDQAVEAAKERVRHDREVNLYISAGGVDSLRSTLAAEGIKKANLWIANWNLSMQNAVNTLETSGDYPIVCVQFASPTSNPDTIVPGGTMTLKEANVDLSVALDSWLHLPEPAPAAPAPAPEPTPAPAPATLSASITIPAQTVTLESTDGGKTWTQK